MRYKSQGQEKVDSQSTNVRSAIPVEGDPSTAELAGNHEKSVPRLES